MNKLLFVHGTLMKGGKHHDLLLESGQVRRLGPARCRGSLYDLGTHAGFVPEGRAWVAGELYRCEDPEALLKTLDVFEEAGASRRRLLPVRWEHGQDDAWVYVFEGDLSPARPIAGGSYKARDRRRARRTR